MQSMSLTQISRIEKKKKMAREHLLVVGGRGGGWKIHKETVIFLLLIKIVRGHSNSLKSK